MQISSEIDYPKDELFNAISSTKADNYLWEILQGWMIFCADQQKDPLEIRERFYFFELLSQHLQSGREEFELSQNKSK